MEVMSSWAFCRTRFQTLITSPQVVSTMSEPISLIRASVVTSVPKAGTMTTSSAVRSSTSSLGVLADQVLDPERADLLVDLGVVDDLAEDEEAAVGEDLCRRVGEVDGPFHAVAKAELLGEFHASHPPPRACRRRRAASRRLRCGNAIPPGPAPPPSHPGCAG